jgi:hypothetical protein
LKGRERVTAQDEKSAVFLGFSSLLYKLRTIMAIGCFSMAEILLIKGLLSRPLLGFR